MSFYTEPPITSFFPRITASKKRKIHTELSPSGSSNRQRDHISRQGIKFKAKEDEQERRNTLDISILHLPSESVGDLSTMRPAQTRTSEKHMPLLASSNAIPQTPKSNRLSPRKKRKTFLQTPPPTDEGAERQRLMKLTLAMPSCISQKSLDLCIGKDFLPTPSTSGRLASHHSRHSDNDRCRVVQGQDLLSPTRPKHSNTPLKANVFIPSSQSQLMADAYSEDEHHLAIVGTAFLQCKRQLPQLSVQPSPPNIIPLNRRDKEKLTSDATQMFVSSSQSQFLSPLEDYDHPQRSQPSSIVSNFELDIIPSSQSQEKELLILSDPEACHRSIHSKKQALPQRTLSDELFSVSILQNSWSNCSLDPEQPIQGTSDIPCVANHDDSSTESESESEPETEEKDSYHRDYCLTPTQSQPHGFSQLSTSDLASLNEDSQDKDSRNFQQSSEDLSLADQTSSFACFPSAVKEFQSMFGSDESYPPDFPMSLR